MIRNSQDSSDRSTGIVVYRASRLEALLEPLERFLRDFPPTEPLAPQTLIAAHPGMKYWLVGALAKKRARGGIVANLRVLLTSSWLDQRAQELLGASAIALSPYRRETLRWRIHELLDGLDTPEVNAYLRGRDTPRRRFQLADRLASLYTQYLVYRPDWLQAWQSGRALGPPSFQQELWRQLRLQIGVPHRAERLADLVGAIERRGETDDEPLHVFGLSHLAPTELHVLRALARHRLVVLYVPDPCREYWGGLRNERAQLQALAKLPLDGELQDSLLQIDHPLLASWGRMGQHFVLALNEGEEQVRVDTRHWEDLIDAPATSPLLLKLQESVRRLNQDDLLLTPTSLLHADARNDRSVRVHACHTPLRELEVLRDALLMELSQRPTLQPADIVVMAPDIHAYLPLVPSVFGAPGAPGNVLPYHFADVAVARTHPVFDAFLTLLDMPSSRIAAPAVIDLLQVPLLARTLQVDENAIERITAWLREARVAWGLDANFRAGFDVPEMAEHSFAWGIDRMLAGHVFGAPDDAQSSPMFDGIWPLASVQGADVEALGALDRLLVEIASIYQDSRQPRLASAWVQRLSLLIDRLFGAVHADDDERDALAQLRGFVHEISDQTESAGVDPLLDFSVVRDLLGHRLALAPARQRLLLGGITFCGMVPQRAIPFRVIAVLGLNEGDYPRNVSSAGLDLMQVQRRLGDRDVRDDDRYLFLETLMAARDGLHLSYIGESAQDGRARNPAAPLAELLQFLDLRADIDPQRTAELRPWRIRHPLQPFDARYFDGRDAALFSFENGWIGRPETASLRSAKTMPTALIDPHAPVSITRLQSFYRDPARTLASGELMIRLDALEDERLAESESLEARADAIDRIARRLVFDALRDRRPLPSQPPDFLTANGLLPAGRLGMQAYDEEREQAQKLLDVADDLACLRDGLPALMPIAIDRDIDGRRWQGRLGRVRNGRGARLLFDAYPKRRQDQLTFKECVPLFIEWALLLLDRNDDATAVEVCLLCLPDSNRVRTESLLPAWVARLNGVDADLRAAQSSGDMQMLAMIQRDLAARLSRLLRVMEDAHRDGLRYFPATSWASLRDDVDAITKAWTGDGQRISGERDREPGYAELMTRGVDLVEDEGALAALRGIATELLAIIAMESMP